jgi:threonine dehydrogenase-like Zn-dependent dehydrogenase
VVELLHDATRHLAAVVLQTCAGLGLSTVVVVGGFAHGIGEPWFAALRRNLADLAVDAGWFRGWTAAALVDLVRAPADAGDATLAGMARYLAARAGLVRRAVKPVGEGRLVMTTGPRPRCGREQFLLHIRYAGVCATDLQILRGERGYEPGVPGHECVAVVAEVGSAVPGLVPGTLVTLNPNHPTDDYRKLGHSVPGVLQDVLVGDLGSLAQVVPLPADTGPAGVLVEPLAAVVRAAELAPGRDVLVIGGGVLGLLHVAVAQAHGARTVVLATRSRDRLRTALAAGASPPDAVVDLDPDPIPAIHTAMGGRGADAAVVAVGGRRGPDVLGRLWPALADGAVVHLFGGFPPGHSVSTGDGPVDPGPLRAEAGRREVKNPAGGRVTLTGSRGGTAADFAAALDLKLDLTPYVSHIVPLAALPAVAAELAGTGTVAGAPALRVVVDLSLQDGRTT